MASGTLSPHSNSFHVWAPVLYVPHLPPTLILSASVYLFIYLFFACTTAVPSTGHHWDPHGKKVRAFLQFMAMTGQQCPILASPAFPLHCHQLCVLAPPPCLSQRGPAFPSSVLGTLFCLGLEERRKRLLYMQVKFKRSFLGNLWEVFGKLAIWET